MRRRWLLVLLAPLGSLLGHQFAYGHHGGDAYHGYLDMLVPAATAAGAVTVAWLVGSRRRLALPGLPALVAAQVAIFLAQEVTERLVAGASIADLLSMPAVRWGVALQFVAAGSVLLALRILRRLLTAAVAWNQSGWIRHAVAAPLAFGHAAPAPSPFGRGAPPRGPPVLA